MKTTHVRYFVVTITTFVAVCLYLDRFCLSVAAKYIEEQFGLTPLQRNFLLDSFFYTYAFAQIPGGWLADKFGSRLMLSIYLAAWSAFTGLMGFATGFTSLLVLRLACGMFEAGAYPSCASLIRRWFPEQERGFASSIVSIGGRVGGAFAPWLTAVLLVQFAKQVAPMHIDPVDFLDLRSWAKHVDDPLNPETEMPPLTREIFRRLNLAPEGVQQVVADVNKFAAADAPPPLTYFQKDAVATYFNVHLGDPDFTKGLKGDELTRLLDPETVTLLQKAEPTEQEALRRNRQVLEKAFPGMVRRADGPAWKYPLIGFGFPGLLLAAVFWYSTRDWPRQHPACSPAEVEYIEGKKASDAELSAGIKPEGVIGPAVPEHAPSARELWRGLLTSPSMWCNCMVQIGTNFSWVFLASMAPTYLQEAHQTPLSRAGWYATLPFLCSIPMIIVGGKLVDVLSRRIGPRWGRSLPVALTRFAAALGFVACTFLSQTWAIVAAFCFIAVASDMGLPGIWAYSIDVGKKNAGLVLGYGNMWGNLGAAVSSTSLGLIFRTFSGGRSLFGLTGWNAVFGVCAVVFVVVGVLAFFIDATENLVRASPAKPETLPATPD